MNCCLPHRIVTTDHRGQAFNSHTCESGPYRENFQLYLGVKEDLEQRKVQQRRMTDKAINRSIKAKKKADLKIVLIGDADVGKTCLVHRYMEGVFQEELRNTVGAAFFLKQYCQSNIAIWDTAGEEKFSGLSAFYCRNANAAIVAYDLNDAKTFESISHRHSQLLESAAENCLICIVGTKKDLLREEDRRVPLSLVYTKTEEMNRKWKSKRHRSNALPYFETSSKTGENVTQVFEFIFETIAPNSVAYPDRSAHKLTVDLDSEGPEKKGSCCK